MGSQGNVKTSTLEANVFTNSWGGMYTKAGLGRCEVDNFSYWIIQMAFEYMEG